MIHPLPEESRDKQVAKPSVRLVFATVRARAAFLTYLDQIISKKVMNPSLAVVLDQLYEPPLAVDVWRDKTE